MISLRSLLTRWLLVAMVGTCSVVGTGLFFYVRHVLSAEFDRALDLRAQALQSLISVHDDGTLDIDINRHVLREYTSADSGDFYRVAADGEVVAASVGDPLGAIGATPMNTFRDARLRNGTRVRGFSREFRPEFEKQEPRLDDDKHTTQRPVHRPQLTVVVARARGPLDKQLWRVLLGIVFAGLAAVATALAASVAIVRTGLSRLDAVAGEMTDIDFTRPNARFVGPAPEELGGVVTRFNAMLERVSATLARERRFSAAVAHELRTPIAELRTATEVALLQSSDAAAVERGLRRAHETSLQLQRLVTLLLAMMRGELLRDNVRLQPVRLGPVLDGVVRRHLDTDRQEINCDPTLVVFADPVLLRAILENLVANAFTHTEDRTRITIGITADAGHVCVTIENQQSTLTPADLPHLFEPFWRKDASRTADGHVGLGLSLTKLYADALHTAVQVEMPEHDRLRVRLRLARPAELPQRDRLSGSGTQQQPAFPVGS